MSGQSKRPNKAARKEAKKAYKQSLTPLGLFSRWLIKWGIIVLGLTLLGWLLIGLERLDEFAPGKVYGLLFFLGGALILFWGYRRFRGKWKDKEFTFDWYLLARVGKVEIFFAVAGLSVMALSTWYFFNPRNFWETIEPVFVLLFVLGFLFGMLTAAGVLFAFAAYGLRSGKYWKILYAVAGLLPFLIFVAICWLISLGLFSQNYVLEILFVLACAGAALGYITHFYLVPAWRKEEETF